MFIEKVISCTNKITAYFFLIYISLILLKALYTRISNVCQQNLYLIFHELFGVLKHVLNYCRVWQKHLVSKYVVILWSNACGRQHGGQMATGCVQTLCSQPIVYLSVGSFYNFQIEFLTLQLKLFWLFLSLCKDVYSLLWFALWKWNFTYFTIRIQEHSVTFHSTFPPATCLRCSFPYSFKDLTIAYFQLSPPSQA